MIKQLDIKLTFLGLFLSSCNLVAENLPTKDVLEETSSPILCTLEPSKQAVKVFNYLHEIKGKKSLSAVMANVNWNLNEAEWVYRHTGKYPAVNSFDYAHLYSSPCNWIDYTDVGVVEKWWKQRGLVAACWHWNVPKKEGNSKEYAFYAPGKGQGQPETDFDITKATIEGTYEHKIVMADLNQIAYCLQLLQQKKIPVLWRPLHEASGGWFWWGAKGPEPYKKLWKLMFSFFAEKGLDNLIWIWTSEGNDPDWYPGDEYVDIIGRDIYNWTDTSQLASAYLQLTDSYPNKIVILSECGGVSKMSDQWKSGAKWGCFMPWYDYNRTKNVHDENVQSPQHIYANIDWWKDAWQQDYILSRDELPSFK